MTDSRSFDPRIRAWLDLMPSQAPDRVVDAVLQAVESTPQVRPSLVVALRRPFLMNRISMLAAAALVVIVAASGAYLLSRSNTPPVGGPSPQPSPASSSPTPAASLTSSTIPTSLQGTWFGTPRASIGSSTTGAAIRISDVAIEFVEPNGSSPLFGSVASVVDGHLAVQSSSQSRGCQPTDAGTYAWSLSPSGQTLTLQAVSDPCSVRENAMPGTWWRANDCINTADACLGTLDPGSYGSQFFVTSLPAGHAWTATYGGVQFTVPDGWANDADWPADFSLSPVADYQSTTAANPQPVARIELIPAVHAESQASPCSHVNAPGVAATPAAVIAWLRTIKQLTVGPSQPLTIDGHAAISVDLGLPSGPAQPCGSDQVLEYIVSQGWPTGGPTNGPNADGILKGARQRLVLVEPSAGNLLAIVISPEDASGFDAFLQEAMPIVESFHFK
jgi:hypothetical protein